MAKTLKFPNEVPCSSAFKINTTSNGSGQTNMRTSEYRNTTTMSSLSRTSQSTHTDMQNDRVETTLAKQATTLRRLNWFSAFLAISVAINTATFAGLTSTLMKRMNRNEETYETPLWRPLNLTETHEKMAEISSRVEKLEIDLRTNAEDIERLDNAETGQNGTRHILAYIEKVNSTIEEHNAELLQIKTEMDSVTAEVQNNSLKIKQLETHRTSERSSFEELVTRVTQLQTQLLTEITTSETLNRTIADNTYRLTQLQTDIVAQNTTIRSIRYLLDLNITDIQDNILLHEAAIMQAQASLGDHNVSLKLHELRIEELESKGEGNQHLITNHSTKLAELETKLNITNITVQDEMFINQDQTAQILELELRLNETKETMLEHYFKLLNASGKVAFSLRQEEAMTAKPGDIIKYKTVILNEGSGYDLNSGEFTAPVSGVYQFSYFIGHSKNPHSQSWARLVANGTVINAAVVDKFHDGQDIQGGNVGIVRLNAGDKAWIEAWYVPEATFHADKGFSTFSGFFIYE